MKEAQPISKDQIKAIVRFLPIFKSEGFQFGHWTSEKGVFPYFTLSREANAFYKALYDNGWIIPFDWVSWQDEAVQYVNDTSLLEEADLETLRRLLTTHVRKDRFCDGHLDCMFECGHITAILQRLQQLDTNL
jgi:Family of unknown function (DUF6508)